MRFCYLCTETKSNPMPSAEKSCVTHSYGQANLQMWTAIKVEFNSPRVEAAEHLFSTPTVICVH